MTESYFLPKQFVKKTNLICEQFSRICLCSQVTTENALLVFEELNQLIQKLIVVQRKWCLLRKLEKGIKERLACIQELLCSGMCETFGIKAINSETFGCGIALLSDVQKNDVILRIPRTSMLSIAGPPATLKFLSTDPIASKMENIALSLKLLSELAHLETSPYYFYIRSLPSFYSTSLYMTIEQVVLLKGSPSLEVLVKNLMSICRQYAYFFNAFLHADQYNGLSFGQRFCFEDYRWAVSTVMSRNNLIPVGAVGLEKMHLVPIWDMINHKPGWVSTDFDLETDELIFYAMEDAAAGNQIFMDYGKRTNAEFLLYSGFVPKFNRHNRLNVTLAVSKSDRLISQRLSLLTLLGLNNPISVQISSDSETLIDLLAFSRVFVMTKDQLDQRLSQLKGNADQEALGDIRPGELRCNAPLDRDAINFLVTRFELLVRMYGTGGLEDNAKCSQLTDLELDCLRLVRADLSILHFSILNLKAVLDNQTATGPPDLDRLEIA